MRHQTLEHRFIKHIPDTLEPGILYVSLEFGSVAHSCCCGCDEEVITPLTPTDWKLIFDGETISLHPSVGSWSLPCRSHYVIKQGRVCTAEPWSDRRIEAERRRDRSAKSKHYDQSPVVETVDLPSTSTELEPPKKARWWSRMWKQISS